MPTISERASVSLRPTSTPPSPQEREEGRDAFADILDRLSGISAVTVHRGASTPEAQLAGAKRMTAMLLRFPHAIAVDALERWPRTENGKFFPTENELHDLCVRIQRGREPRTALQQPADEGKFTNPAERAVMVQKLRALTLAMIARNGKAVDVSVESQVTRDEFGRLRVLFAAQDAKDAAWRGS